MVLKQTTNMRLSVQNIDWSLYAIIDAEWLQGRSIQTITEQLIYGGAGIIQYRDKVSESGEFYRNAEMIQTIAKKHCIPFIINDRVDIALAVDATGVHLGHNDLPLCIARRIIKRHMLIGGSVSSVQDFSDMESADYLGVGAVFTTDTHKEYTITGLDVLRELREKWAGPMVGIGGVDLQNVQSVINAGADGVAVISAILKTRDVKKTTGKFTELIRSIKSKEEAPNHG